MMYVAYCEVCVTMADLAISRTSVMAPFHSVNRRNSVEQRGQKRMNSKSDRQPLIDYRKSVRMQGGSRETNTGLLYLNKLYVMAKVYVGRVERKRRKSER